MSDPDAVVEPIPPPQPPRPTTTRMGSTPQSQLEADEMYARQLAEHYDASAPYDQQRSNRGPSANPQRGQNLKPNELFDENHSFMDDDLPVIKENLRKGFLETQTKVNGWITNLKKRIDGEDIDGNSQGGPVQGYNTGSSNTQYGSRRSGDVGRRSGDYNRYDADPQVLGDDFSGIQLNDDGSKWIEQSCWYRVNDRTGQARRSTRPLANPDLFKPTPATPKGSDSRKVSFQQNDRSEEDLYRSSPKTAAKDSTPGGKQSKWQPLSTVEPSPVGEADNDPFSLGDSEDEKESKDRIGGKEVRMEDTERLKKVASQASHSEPSRKPEPAETSGTKDKLAEDQLTGKV